MNITKCDICKKEIKNRQEVCIGYCMPLPQYSLCLKCSKPIVVFLEKHELIEKSKS